MSERDGYWEGYAAGVESVRNAGEQVVSERDDARRQLARHGAWEERLSIAHQAFNVIYNVAQTGDWERGKKLLVELRREWDEAKVPSPAAREATTKMVMCSHGINHSGERHGCDGCCKVADDNSSCTATTAA